jgi:hypothetical protein
VAGTHIRKVRPVGEGCPFGFLRGPRRRDRLFTGSLPQGFLKVINMSLQRQRFLLPEAVFNADFGLLQRRKGHRRFAMTLILDFKRLV